MWGNFPFCFKSINTDSKSLKSTEPSSFNNHFYIYHPPHIIQYTFFLLTLVFPRNQLYLRSCGLDWSLNKIQSPLCLRQMQDWIKNMGWFKTRPRPLKKKGSETSLKIKPIASTTTLLTCAFHWIVTQKDRGGAPFSRLCICIHLKLFQTIKQTYPVCCKSKYAFQSLASRHL